MSNVKDKQNFADAPSANKTLRLYTKLALIPAGFTRLLQLPSNRRHWQICTPNSQTEHSFSIHGPARRLRCRSHWPPWYKYPLFIPLRSSLSPCPCHCAVILSDISSLLADRPVDLENPVLPSLHISYLLPNVLVAFNCSPEQQTRVRQ